MRRARSVVCSSRRSSGRADELVARAEGRAVGPKQNQEGAAAGGAELERGLEAVHRVHGSGRDPEARERVRAS